MIQTMESSRLKLLYLPASCICLQYNHSARNTDVVSLYECEECSRSPFLAKPRTPPKQPSPDLEKQPITVIL